MTQRSDDAVALTKKCSRCKETKAREEFYGDRSRGDGLSTTCKQCNRERRKMMRARLLKRKAGTLPKVKSKTCHKCGQTKPAMDFYVFASNRDGLSDLCKRCEREKGRAYHQRLSARYPTELLHIESKWCPLCGEKRCVSEFYKAPGKAGGYRTLCKECDSRASAEYAKRIADREFSEIRPKGTKRCSFCQRRLPAKEFNYCRSNADGLASYCRACGIEYKEQHYKEKQQDYYDRTVDRRQRYPERDRAYRTIQAALNSGEIVRPETCTKCGASGYIVAHHEDYEDPLDFKWLCLSCSRQIRADQRRKKR